MPPDAHEPTATPTHPRWLRAVAWLMSLGLIGVTVGATANSRAQAGDASVGRQLYEKRCARCHSPDQHGEGPAHRGVVGRTAGTLPNFDYSAAVRNSRLVWTANTLDAWLSDPETMLPGQAMDVQVSDPASRRHLIAYLSTLKR